jgi:hypothetical protein
MTGKLPIIIEELLRYRESSKKWTKKFKDMKHNEYLCPSVERQLNRILDCFIKYHSIASDVQGINDRGTDVQLRYYIKSETGDSICKFIAFQIKSYDDLNSKSYLRDLKAQCFEAKGEFKESLDHYYILICTDVFKDKNKIREIKKAFSTQNDVTVIDPIYMATFLRLNPIRISSLVSTLIRDDDIVYERALNDLAMLTPTEIAVYAEIVVEMTVSLNCLIDIERIKENDFLKRLYSRIPDYPRDTYFYLEEVNLQSSNEIDDEEIEEEECIDRHRGFETRFSEDIDVLTEAYLILVIQVM